MNIAASQLGTPQFNELFDGLCSGRGLTVVLVRCDGGVLYCSQRAREQLIRGPLVIEAGYLRLTNQAQDLRLRDALAGPTAVGHNSILVVRRQGQGPLFIEIAPAESEDRRLLMVRDPNWVGESDIAKLREAFGMTVREAELASHLASGHRLAAFAADRGLTQNTVKTHLKQCFKKVGVTSQMQLVAYVLAVLR